MHKSAVAHVEVPPQHSIDEVLLYWNSAVLSGEGLNVPRRPDLLLGVDHVLNRSPDKVHLLITHLLLAEALGQHLWVSLVLQDQGPSQRAGDPELRRQLRHAWLVSTPEADDGEEISCPQLAASPKTVFGDSLICFETLPQWKLVNRPELASLPPL